MVSDLALRLLFGLAAALLPLPSRQIPPAFFRTLHWIALGLAVLAAVDLFVHAAPEFARIAIVGCAVLAYLASVAWGLGLPRLGWPLTAALTLGATLLVDGSRGPSAPPLERAAGLVSGLYLGTLLCAMLLGHHYLTAPSMSIQPLVSAIRSAGLALLARAGLALAALAALRPAHPSSLLLLMRWGLGLAAPAVGLFLAHRTARIRSTQSATGILYATLILALLGELASLVLARSTAVTY